MFQNDCIVSLISALGTDGYLLTYISESVKHSSGALKLCRGEPTRHLVRDLANPGTPDGTEVFEALKNALAAPGGSPFAPPRWSSRHAAVSLPSNAATVDFNPLVFSDTAVIQASQSKNFSGSLDSVPRIAFQLWRPTSSNLSISASLNGTPVDTLGAAHEPPGEVVQGLTLDQWILTSPPSGSWSISLSNNTGTPTEYQVSVVTNSPKQLYAVSTSEVVFAGSSVTLEALFQDHSTNPASGIPGASVRAYVTRPSGSIPEEVILNDNDSDGIYANSIATGPNESGMYAIRYVAQLGQVVREAVVALAVIRADSDSDGLLDEAEIYTSGTDYLIADTDGDGYADGPEEGTPLCGNGANDDDKTGTGLVADDTLINDGCPAAGNPEVGANCLNGTDDDGDGYRNDGCPQVGAFSEAQFKIGTNPADRCGVGVGPDPSTAWPPDFVSGGIPDSTDRINILDLVSFIAPAPTRKLDTAPGQPNFNMRWDLIPGRQVFSSWINVTDFTAFIAANSLGFPPMFGGTTKAFNGPTCMD